MALEDLIAKFEAFTSPDEAVTPDIDAVLSGVTEVYNQDISIRDHAVQTREATIAEMKKANDVLKQANYDLLMKQPAGKVADNGKTVDDVEDDEAERAATIKVADLFTKRK